MPNLIKNDFWQKVTPASAIVRRRGYIEIPAFDIDYTVLSANKAGLIVGVFNYVSTNNITLRDIPEMPEDANYILCLKYRMEDGSVFRYKLWEIDNDRVSFPLYTGQIIKKNFQVEVWSTDDTGNVTMADILTINVSAFRARSLVDDASTFKFVEESDVVIDLKSTSTAGNFAQTGTGLGQAFTPDGTLQYFQSGGQDILFSAGWYVIRYITNAFEAVTGSGNWRAGLWSIETDPAVIGPPDVGSDTDFASEVLVEAAYPNSYSLIGLFELTIARKVGLQLINVPASQAGTVTFAIACANKLPLTFTNSQHGTPST